MTATITALDTSVTWDNGWKAEDVANNPILFLVKETPANAEVKLTPVGPWVRPSLDDFQSVVAFHELSGPVEVSGDAPDSPAMESEEGVIY